MDSAQNQFHELSFYTMAHGDKRFIHQHAVDAFAVQTADENTKPIKFFYGLAGLYLLIEKQFTGREVQQMHVLMSQSKKPWPQIHLPVDRGAIRVENVLSTEPGEARDEMIYNWCESVWLAFANYHETMAEWMQEYLQQGKTRKLQ
jgi:hypothetical protein